MSSRIPQTGKLFLSNIIAAACTAALLSSSCSAPKQSEQQTLLVSSAISLKEALEEIADKFKAEQNCSVVFNYASSGELAAQLRHGAPVDVFISASPEVIDELAKQGIINAETISKIAGNSLVVISSKKTFASLQELNSAQNISIGNPQTVPVGTLAKEALTKSGLYESLLLKKQLVFAENARQVLTYVEQGDAEAGIVYNTDARLCSSCKIGFSIPESASGPVTYEAGTVASSKSKDLAKKLMQCLNSPIAKEIFKKKGFLIE